MIVLKEGKKCPPFRSPTFKRQHLITAETQISLTNRGSVGEVAAYLSPGYLGILYRSTTPSDQRAEFQASGNCVSLKSWTENEFRLQTHVKQNLLSTSAAKCHVRAESCRGCHTEVRPTRSFVFFSRRRIDSGEQGLLHDILCFRQTTSSSELFSNSSLISLLCLHFHSQTRSPPDQSRPLTPPSSQYSITIQQQKSRGDL